MTTRKEDIDNTPTGSHRELREYARGSLDSDHHDVYPHAGLIQDDEVREVLSFMAANYEPPRDESGKIIEGFPTDFWSTDFAQRAIKKHATETAAKAIANDNVSQISYITGLPSYKSDVSGLHAINQLADWLVNSEQCKLVYLAALMGRGKTDLSCLMMEVVNDHFDRVSQSVEEESIETPEFAANFAVDAGDDADVLHIDNYDDLVEWGSEGGSDQERWFIFDEASTELTAQSGKNAQDVAEIFAPFVKKMRKMGINMIIIGHDKGDVHVAIRSLADYVDKPDLKTASFYAGISKREPVEHLFDLGGIPQTSWTFDTDDTAEWSWGSAVEDDADDDLGYTQEDIKTEIAERAARLWKQTELTQGEVAEALSNEHISISPATISRKAQSMKVIGNQTKNGAKA